MGSCLDRPGFTKGACPQSPGMAPCAPSRGALMRHATKTVPAPTLSKTPPPPSLHRIATPPFCPNRQGTLSPALSRRAGRGGQTPPRPLTGPLPPHVHAHKLRLSKFWLRCRQRTFFSYDHTPSSCSLITRPSRLRGHAFSGSSDAPGRVQVSPPSRRAPWPDAERESCERWLYRKVGQADDGHGQDPWPLAFCSATRSRPPPSAFCPPPSAPSPSASACVCFLS